MTEVDRQDEIQKKMRLLDKNQKAYLGDTSTMIKKQSDALQLLMKENEMLQQELSNTYKSRSAKQNIQHQNAVGHLTEQIEGLERKIQLEDGHLTEYTDELDKVRKAIMNARRTMGGVNVTKENTTMVDKQVKTLEQKLDQALLKFNEALTQNKSLREEIDNLRRERVVFDGIYKKLERELHEKKKQMADIIEQSNLAYEERDVATADLAALKVAAEKDMMQYEEHFKELDAMIEADKRLKETLKQNASPKFKPTLSRKENHGETEDEKMKKTMAKQPVVHVEETVNIEEVIAQLMEGTGIHDLEELLEKFLQAEEQNFSLYNFVNDLHNEVEALEESIAHLQAEHKKHKGQTGDPSRQRTLKELEEQLARTERTSEEYIERTGKAEEIIHELRVGIEAVFGKLACNLDEMNEVLGTTQCTESNMMTFLGIIEQRTTELLAQYNLQVAMHEQKRERPAPGPEDEDGGPRIKFLGQGPPVPFSQSPLHHLVGALPSTGDNLGADADDAEDDRVLTQEELRAQTEMRLAAKEEQKALGREAKKKRQMRKKTAVFDGGL